MDDRASVEKQDQDVQFDADEPVKIEKFVAVESYSLPCSNIILVEPYDQQRARWPKLGHPILATYTNTAILVYQAFNHTIANWAIKHQRFDTCEAFSNGRMTWIKPNFLWMMYRCDWCRAKNQERVLGIWLKLEAFHELLAVSEQSSPNRLYNSKEAWTKARQTKKTLKGHENWTGRVNIQWDPDHSPSGGKFNRRAIQIGIKGVPWWPTGEKFEKIIDMTPFVESQQANATGSTSWPALLTPSEHIYQVPDPDIAFHCGSDTTEQQIVEEKDFISKNIPGSSK